MINEIARERVTGPLAPHSVGFAAELATAGYTRQSVDRHLRLMAEVSRWLNDVGATALAPGEGRAFLAWRRQARSARHRQVTAKMLQPLVDYLHRAGAIATIASVPIEPEIDATLRKYHVWLAGVRGVSASCVRIDSV
jgi:hypothetical protein